MSTRKILTINHVFEIMVEYANNGGDWKAAFEKVMPARKGAKVIGEKDQEKEEAQVDGQKVADDVAPQAAA
jgi:hypothetical protein